MGTKTNVDVDEDADIRVDNVGIYKNTYEKKARTMKKYRQESSTNSITQKCITSKDDMSWLYQ